MKYIQSKFHRACRHHHIKHLAYASSSSVYGNNTKMPLSTSDNVDHPISLYAATKKSNELMAHTYSHLFGLPTTGLRFFTVYGPWGRPDMALFLFTKAILAGQPIKVFNNGNVPVPPVPWTYFSPPGWNAKQIPLGVRDFTYVDDIVEGVTRVIDNPPSREIREANISPGPVGIQNKIPATNFSSGEEEYSANRRREVVNSDGVVEKPVASGQPPEAPYKIYNIGNSSPVPLMEYI
jgi:nucleoside-diphosphate-sugar epimerase